MDTVILKEVIVTTLTRRGNGDTTSIRVITEYWDKDGTKLAEVDPSENAERVTKEDLRDAMLGASFFKTIADFNEWYKRNFLNY